MSGPRTGDELDLRIVVQGLAEFDGGAGKRRQQSSIQRHTVYLTCRTPQKLIESDCEIQRVDAALRRRLVQGIALESTVEYTYERTAIKSAKFR